MKMEQKNNDIKRTWLHKTEHLLVSKMLLASNAETWVQFLHLGIFYASFYTDVFGNTHGSQQYLPSKSNRFYLIFTKRAVWVHYMETWAWDCIWVTTVNIAGVELVKNVVHTESNKFYLLFNKLALCGIGFRASSFKVKETRAENV